MQIFLRRQFAGNVKACFLKEKIRTEIQNVSAEIFTQRAKR